jgi:hypothetical protein
MIGAIDPSYDQADEMANPSAPPFIPQAYPIDQQNSNSIFNFGLG